LITSFTIVSNNKMDNTVLLIDEIGSSPEPVVVHRRRLFPNGKRLSGVNIRKKFDEGWFNGKITNL
jgi:hypothetical protein